MKIIVTFKSDKIVKYDDVKEVKYDDHKVIIIDIHYCVGIFHEDEIVNIEIELY